ncbi:MAG: tetratricopeptide repeat protein [Eubacteriales bacterium]|nr:tetratricopeptide repeat protein [Eubacteriales bacterium]
MRRGTKLQRISNSYFNLGLERAKLKDLSGAAGFLKRALKFDKYNTDARNLLGLIFYETGETADALCQWIISVNLQPEGNDADRYLGEVQRNERQLAVDRAAIKKFNQALATAKQSGEDFAIIQLQHLVAERPHYLKANLLLAILYMQKGEYKKAGNSLLGVLKIDRNNPTALILLDEVKRKTGRDEVEQKKMKKAFSHRQLVDDEVIMPMQRATISPLKVTLIIAASIAIGIISFLVLVLPGIKKSYILDANKRILENNRQVSSINSKYTSLEEEFNSLKLKYDEVSQKLEAFQQENADFSSMYSKLNMIIQDFNEDKVTNAVKSFMTINRDMEILQTEPLLSLLKEVDDLMYNRGYDRVVSLGTNSWNGGNLEQALVYYDMALSIDPDDPECMYLKARVLQLQQRITEANEIFDKIIGEHPESNYADKAVQARGY